MLDDWDRCFSNCEPVGFRLREVCANRWVRFHSLPESKRYAESDDEYAEVLTRHNAIMDELAHSSGQVVLVTTGYSDSPVPRRPYPEVVAFDPAATHWRTVAMHRVSDHFTDPSYWHMFASVREWRSGTFDPLVRFVADDVVANVLVVAPDCRWVLHPYDGGMDVIAGSPEARRRLAQLHSSWLSPHPHGL